MINLSFVKYQGAGNDFILIDLRHDSPLIDLPALARRVCERRRGIGADGLLVLLPSMLGDCRMRIFNADGSEASMCGNGLRCVVDFLNLPNLRVETGAGVLSCRKKEAEIAVSLGAPQILHWPITLPEGELYVLNTGVPHAVLFVENLDAIDLLKRGQAIRFHPCFSPEGVNVNFVLVTPEKKVLVRTYERGVEGETLACGTGAAAAAYAAAQRYHLSGPVAVWTRSSFEGGIRFQEQMCFLFPKKELSPAQIEMIGRAEKVFEGTLKI